MSNFTDAIAELLKKREITEDQEELLQALAPYSEYLLKLPRDLHSKSQKKRGAITESQLNFFTTQVARTAVQTRELLRAINAKRSLGPLAFSLIKNPENQRYYQVIGTIARGGFAIVKLLRDCISDEEFVVKIFGRKGTKSASRVKLGKTEKERIAYYAPERLLGFVHRQYNVAGDSKEYLFMPHLGKDLYAYSHHIVETKKLKQTDVEQQIVYLCKEITRLVYDLKEKKLTHGDLKLENITVDKQGVVSIIDCESLSAPDQKRNFRATAHYLTPENFTRAQTGLSIDSTYEADCYAMVCAMALMMQFSLFKEYKFYFGQGQEIYPLTQSAFPLIQSDFSPIILELVKQINRGLSRNPEERPSIDDWYSFFSTLKYAAYFLHNPFAKEVEVEKLSEKLASNDPFKSSVFFSSDECFYNQYRPKMQPPSAPKTEGVNPPSDRKLSSH